MQGLCAIEKLMLEYFLGLDLNIKPTSKLNFMLLTCFYLLLEIDRV
jgi:hypothetical protein